MTDEARRYRQEQEIFGFAIAHDLRGPLRSMSLYSKLLKRKYPELQAEASHLSAIDKGIEEVGYLIHSIQAFAQLSTGIGKVTRIPMAELCEEVYGEVIKLEEPGRVVDFQVDGLRDAFGERPLVRQLIFNLLSNSLKYSRSNTRAMIRISGVMTEGAYFYQVEDNGVGFAPEDAERILSVFERGEQARFEDGFGIGLAVARRIVERYGGIIRAEGEPGSGARFCFTLPDKKML